MKLMIAGSLFLLLGMIGLPLIALAEMHEVQTIPPISCGPKCVLETIRFDAAAEAKTFAETNGGKYYQGDTGEFFVDIQLTELESHAL